MAANLKAAVAEWLSPRVDAFGFAPVERFADAPPEHHPARVCRDAETVIVFGRLVPRGILHSPDYGLYLLHRSYHTVYPYLNEVGMDLANFVESRGGLAVQIPSFAPLVYQGAEPWGLLSLKHAAVAAGLGGFGRGDVVLHPDHGSMLRLGAVVTSARIEGDPVLGEDPCPPGCRACREACPSGAFSDGPFRKMACLAHTIRHGIYPLALRDEAGRKNIELIINKAGYDYWLKCDECIKVCPRNRVRGGE